MIARMRVRERDVVALSRFGSPELLADWDVEGYVGVFSVNVREVWAAPRYGPAAPASRRVDLEGADPLLDAIARAVRERSPIGGRVYVTKWRVEAWVWQGVAECIVRFEHVDRRPAPQMPVVTPPREASCPRCSSSDFDGARCGVCRFERPEVTA